MRFKRTSAVILFFLSATFVTGCLGSNSKQSTVTSTTLAQQEKALADVVAKSALLAAYTTAKSLYAKSEDWGTVTVPRLTAANKALVYLDSPSFADNEVSVSASTDGGIVLAVHSDSGECFVIRQAPNGPKQFSTGNCVAVATGGLKFNTDRETGWATTTTTSE